MYKKIIIILIIIILGALAYFLRPKSETANEPGNKELDSITEPAEPGQKRIDFSQTSPIYRFSAEIDEDWEAEYISAIQAVNIYNPESSQITTLEKSQIFIRFFEANDFLTLSTVDIMDREEDEVDGRAAVRYKIKKKAGVPNFPDQPLWRSGRHDLIDIRLTQNNPSVFYVIAQSPALDEDIFEEFISSLVFHNDEAAFVAPIARAAERITKKPFGLRVSPSDSPVQPERFSGYHNAIDFEIFPGEEDKNIEINAVCGGDIIRKQTSSGYGGLLVQECLLQDQPITVMYGHVRLSSIKKNPGDYLAPGEPVGFLGAGFGSETDGERKHLHLGIHRGPNIDIRGYAQNESELREWINPAFILD